MEIDPNIPHPYYSLGIAYSDIEDLESSVKNLNKAIEIDTENEKAIIMRAFVYNRMANYRKSFTDANKLIKLNPENAFAYWLRGLAKNHIGFYDPCPDLEKSCEMGVGCEDYKTWCEEE